MFITSVQMSTADFSSLCEQIWWLHAKKCLLLAFLFSFVLFKNDSSKEKKIIDALVKGNEVTTTKSDAQETSFPHFSVVKKNIYGYFFLIDFFKILSNPIVSHWVVEVQFLSLFGFTSHWEHRAKGVYAMPGKLGMGVTVVLTNPTGIPESLLFCHLPCSWGWTNGQVMILASEG